MGYLREGSIVEGMVTGIENYGIFIKIDDKYSGLVHISEITNGFVKNVGTYAMLGEKIYVEIIKIDEVNCKCILSIKDINYRINSEHDFLHESLKGFSPLKHHLQIWINEKITELHDSDAN